MTFLFPLGMAALGALVPLVVLYLLKQKRLEEKVPANFLWARALDDLRASSLFQRFRAPLLFLLQAASIALCALAAAGASLDLDVGHDPRRIVLLLDRSASMKCADLDGATRFEVAREHARSAIGSLARSDEMMIVAFDRRAEVVQAFTPDTDRLRDALDSVAPRDLPTSLADAIETAVSFARASRGFAPELLVVSDGNVEDELPDVPFPVKYVRVGTSGANQGIAGVSVTRAPGEAPQVLVRIENGEPRAVQRRVVLQAGADVLNARDVDLPPEGDTAVFFEIAEVAGETVVEMSAVLEGADALSADDRVDFLLRPAVPRNGLVVRREPSVALDPLRLSKLRPGLVLVGVTPEDAKAQIRAGTPRVDLVVYEGEAPDTLPDVAAQVYVNCVPPGAGLARVGALSDPIVIDWSRTHAVTARCQFDDVFVLEAQQFAGVERSLPLVETTGGPIVLLTPVPGREVLVIAFDPAKSNIALKLSWPLFLANSLDYLLAGVSREGEEAILRTGTVLPLDPSRGPYTAETPAGATVAVTPDATGRPVFRDGVSNGVHKVRDAAGRESLHAFALLDAREAHVAPRDRIVVGGVAQASDPAGIRRNVLLRDPLLLAVLGVLILEWAVWCGRR